jgi:hypothetical protein
LGGFPAPFPGMTPARLRGDEKRRGVCVKITIHDTVKRAWGMFETLVTVVDDQGEVWNFPLEATEEIEKTEMLKAVEQYVNDMITRKQAIDLVDKETARVEAISTINKNLAYLEGSAFITAKQMDDITDIIGV